MGLLDHLGIERADVFGFSLGGLTTYEMLVHHPDRIRRAVVASADHRNDRGGEVDPERLPTEADFAAMRDAYAAVAPDPSHFEAFAEKTGAMVHGFEGWTDDQLRAIDAPVLVLIGDTDFILVPNAAEAAELLPHGQLAVLPGDDPHGHDPKRIGRPGGGDIPSTRCPERCAHRGAAMKILTRMCTSLDGYVTTPDGWPVQLAFHGWDAGALGFYELQARCDAVLMGRTTFEPALTAPFWPWGDVPVYVLGSRRRDGTPDGVIIEEDPSLLLERLRASNTGGDVDLVGGPKTIETFRALGALDEIRLLALPIFTGAGRRLTPDLGTDTALTLADTRTWPGGVAELTYSVDPAVATGDH